MKTFAAAALGVGIMSAAALSGAPAHAAPSGGVTATYGCQSATFTNHTSKTTIVTYGHAGSESDDTVTVAPGGSKSVKVRTSESKNFGWTARTTSGSQISVEDFPGVNLLKYCGSGSSSSGKDSSGGLAKTGV